MRCITEEEKTLIKDLVAKVENYTNSSDSFFIRNIVPIIVAVGVCFVVGLIVLIPWLRDKLKLKDAENMLKNAKAMIEELKAAYPDVVFDIKNVEKDPELLNNFELVNGNTPALIMLDTSNNICRFQFACADKALLEQSIKAALGE